MSETTETTGAEALEAKEVKYTSTGKVRKITEKGTIPDVRVTLNGVEYVYEPARMVTPNKAEDLRQSMFKAVALLDEVKVGVVTAIPKGAKGMYIGQAKTSRSLITSLVKDHNMNTEDVSVFINLFIKYRKPADFATHGVEFAPGFISNEVINELKKNYGLSNYRAVEKPNFIFDEDEANVEDTAEEVIENATEEVEEATPDVEEELEGDEPEDEDSEEEEVEE